LPIFVDRGAPAISIDLGALLGSLEMLVKASPNSNTKSRQHPHPVGRLL